MNKYKKKSLKETAKLKEIITLLKKKQNYSWDIEGKEILNTPNKYFLTKEDFRRLKFLMLSEIPDNYRIKLWLLTSGALLDKSNNPQYYKKLTEFPEGIPSAYENQIQIDLHRTFPKDPFFQDHQNLASLKNILLAYSRRNMSIGYLQGFNFIAGKIFKTVKNEEDSFWIFVEIIENILPLNYYSAFVGIMVDTTILHILLKMYHKEAYQHLVDLNYDMNLSNLLYKWFICLFISSTHENISTIILDSLFLQGNITLFYATLGIFNMLKYDIMQKDSFEDLYVLFDNDINNYSDVEHIYFYCIIKSYDFDYNFLKRNRVEFEKPVIQNVKEKNLERKELQNKNKNKNSTSSNIQTNSQVNFCKINNICSRDWPFCVNNLDEEESSLEFLILQLGEKINVIENYFFQECFKTNYRRSKSIDLKQVKFITNCHNNRKISNNNNKNYNLRRYTDTNEVDEDSISSSSSSNSQIDNINKNSKDDSIINKLSNDLNLNEENKNNDMNVDCISNTNNLNKEPIRVRFRNSDLDISKKNSFAIDTDIDKVKNLKKNSSYDDLNHTNFFTPQKSSFQDERRHKDNISKVSDTDKLREEYFNLKETNHNNDRFNKNESIKTPSQASNYRLDCKDSNTINQNHYIKVKENAINTFNCINGSSNENYGYANTLDYNNNKQKLNEILSRRSTSFFNPDHSKINIESHNSTGYCNNSKSSFRKKRNTLKISSLNNRCLSKSPQKINWTLTNKEAMRYRAYLNLLIERQPHYCNIDTDDLVKENINIIDKMKNEEMIKKRALSLVITAISRKSIQKENYFSKLNTFHRNSTLTFDDQEKKEKSGKLSNTNTISRNNDIIKTTINECESESNNYFIFESGDTNYIDKINKSIFESNVSINNKHSDKHCESSTAKIRNNDINNNYNDTNITKFENISNTPDNDKKIPKKGIIFNDKSDLDLDI